MSSYIFIVGLHGVGKDTVAKALPYRKVVSYTTRPIRDGEVDGVDHNFITHHKAVQIMAQNEDNIIAKTEMGNDIYFGIDKIEDANTYVYIINPDGVRWFRENHPEIPCFVVGLSATIDILLDRLENRGDDMNYAMQRYNDEVDDWRVFVDMCEYDILLNVEENDPQTISSIIQDLVDYYI